MFIAIEKADRLGLYMDCAAMDPKIVLICISSDFVSQIG
jgi:hypothetical protein